MRITDVYNSKAIALVQEENASNRIAYLGEGLFPTKKKASLDLKWIKGSKGLPVSLMPSAFDTVSTIRSREGIELNETEMAFFKESMLVKEKDEQDIMRVQDATDPFAQEVIDRIYDDANNLVEGARVVPERMRMALLSGTTISFQADGATYAYNYDKDGSYAANNQLQLSGTSKWSDVANSDPMADIETAQDKVEALTGVRPDLLIVSKATMNLLKQNAKVRNYILAQNTTANVMVTDARVKAIFNEELGVNIVVYTKQYKNEQGIAQKFYPDNHATLVPNKKLGNTWYGMTPDERTGVMDKSKDVSLVDGAIAVSVKLTDDPVHTKTTVSEIVLPSFESMNETYQISW